jgi:hypothetical protein
MSGVFRNIAPPPLTARRVCAFPVFGAGRGHTRWVERVNSSEDARHCSVLYICQYFVYTPITNAAALYLSGIVFSLDLTRGGAWGQAKGGKLAVKRSGVYLFYSRRRDPTYIPYLSNLLRRIRLEFLD